ncbi:RNA polymerase factor sigma-54 [Mesorhizobium sp. NBSH29]|uniref:RNA polymerase factor sigma-54 n=1 Tax=Mesorhizobium sp. NBSH29 TaxID=2654249 RepID=UPI0018965FD7|nr:RNA polymerase factor sigma-54 [Mesorhizobium sp. NBSH29]QPC86198.1 RNA polymerase factor sigma-54 [Mesorhizobium sp. NBSH29]
MALAARLQLRQSQSLVMTPQLLQSIRLLQFTHLELEKFVDEEIERNPLLERVDQRDDGPVAPIEPEQPDAYNDSNWFTETGTPASAEKMAERLDTSLENVFPDDTGTSERLGPDLSSQWKSAGGSGSGSNFSPFDRLDVEDMAEASVTLREHVGQQIALGFGSAVTRLIAQDLADALDDAGYLRADIAEVAERLGCTEQDVQSVLATCQNFEPVGLFARDLAECLMLQLAARDRLDPAMRALIENLDLLAKRDFHSLKKICGVDEQDLLDMLAEIRALDPRPGMAFSGGHTDTIVADVIVKPASDGSWAIELNVETLPRVLVDQIYFANVSSHAKGQAEKDFLTECMQDATWLTRSLDQRAKTILKVASEIVRQQDAFLLHGIRHLRPLNLRTVADAIGMHESTVSRVTSNKYMMTPRGVFELRFFFTASIASAEGGDAHSSEAVRDRIRELIDTERAVNVLSDDAIVDMLKTKGVEIARRTVAKYREGMNIPSSVQRRREKRAIAAVAR